MTEDQVKNKVFEMVKSKEFNSSIETGINKAFTCGALNTESFPDNFVLPRIILSVILENLAIQYGPINKQDKKDARNLKHFI